jgi:membrane associated rhomboid family serine protease
VGFQCVDCVREQARTIRPVRTTFGGRAPATAVPVVTRTIVGLCVLVFALQWVAPETTSRFAFVPALAFSEPWRFLTSAFLHSTSFLLHIVFNMYTLWMVGPYLEGLLGRLRMAALYLLCAVGGSVGYLALANPANDSWFSGVVGASGAVVGLFGAAIVGNRRLGRDNGPLVGFVAITALLGFLPGLNVAWQAHLGGLLTGMAVGAVLAYTPPGRRGLGHAAGVGAVLVLLVLVVVVKLAVSPYAVT